MIVIICLCAAGCSGALTAALVFYRKLVPEAELEKHWRKLIGLVIVLAVRVPIMALLSMNDTRAADGVYVNGFVGQYAQDRTALIGTREAKVATYKDAERELAEIEAKLKTLKTERTPAQVPARALVRMRVCAPHSVAVGWPPLLGALSRVCGCAAALRVLDRYRVCAPLTGRRGGTGSATE